MKRKIIQALQLMHAHVKGSLTHHGDPMRFVLKDMPYFAQWESPSLIDKFISRTMQGRDDPEWEKSGALSREEYEKWSWNGCGMACLKMILAHAQKKEVPLVTLAKQCLAYGGYQEPLDISPGLFYKPFCEFVQAEYGLRAVATSALTISGICHALAEGKYVIASVNYEIRHPENTPEKKGGHLVVIVGYDKEKKMLYLHNPSGTSEQSRAFAEISFKNFKKFFASKGMLINS